MNDLESISPTLIRRLLESEVTSQEIARHTGINQQVVNSFRRGAKDKPLTQLEDMRLNLARTLTKEARRQKIQSLDSVFYTREEISTALDYPSEAVKELEKTTGVNAFKLGLAKKYAKDEKAFGFIRLGVVMRIMEKMNS